jgi:Thioesterase-like superfamily
MADAFYLPLGGDVFRPTQHTIGPWAPDNQHMGPPSALLARQVERAVPNPDMTLARITVEILGPVPVADLTTRAWVERPGKSVQLIGAELVAGDRPVARTWSWWIARTDTSHVVAGLPDRLPRKETGTPMPMPEGWHIGYLGAMEWLSIRGGMGADGPATVWVRQRVPTVDGEEPTGLQRLMAVADSGNGASSRLDLRRWFFINTELTVHLWREPLGEWIGLDADTILGPAGTGLAASTLHDETGAVARGAQALLVRPR